MRYLVKWEIDIDASSPREAAEKALEIQRDPEARAMVFEVTKRLGGPVVTTYEVDLSPTN